MGTPSAVLPRVALGTSVAGMLALLPACFSLSLISGGPGDGDAGAVADGGVDAPETGRGPTTGPASDLALGQQTPKSIVVDDTTVYWLNLASGGNPGAIMKIAKAGGAPQILVPNIAQPYALTTDAISVYWQSYCSTCGGGPQPELRKVDKAGGTASLLSTSTNDSNKYFGLSVQGGRIYWAAGGQCPDFKPCLSGGIVLSVGTDGASPTASVASLGAVTVLAVDGTDIYAGSTGQVLKLSKAGGNPFVFATTSGVVSAITLDGTSVFWTDATAVHRLDKSAAGAKATDLATAQDTPSAIALDDANVYWTNAGDGTVKATPKAAKASDTPTLLASGESEPMGIAVDTSGVYWTNHGDGRIRVVRH